MRPIEHTYENYFIISHVMGSFTCPDRDELVKPIGFGCIGVPSKGGGGHQKQTGFGTSQLN